MPLRALSRRLLSVGIPFDALTRDIWLLCLSNVIGAFGEGLYFWVFPIYIRSLQADYVQLGIVFSALYGVSALAPLPGGFLADHFDRKKILILAWTPWVLAPLIYSFASNWVQLIPGTIFWGISMIGLPAMNAYIITSVRDKTKLTSALAVVWSSYSFSYIFAPAVGAFLATVVGMQWVLRVSSVFCAVATGIFLLLASQRPRTEASETSPTSVGNHSPLNTGLKRKLLLWSVFYTVTTFFTTIGRTFVQTFLTEQVLLSEFYIGVFGSLNFAGITFIGLTMGRLGDRWRKSYALGICVLLYALSMIPIMFVREPIFLMSAAFFYGGVVVIGSLISSYVGSIAPAHRRGFWVSIPQTFSLVAAFAAPYLGGYLYTQSPYSAFMVSILPMPFLAAFAFFALKE